MLIALNIQWVFVSQISKQLLLIRTSIEPLPDALQLRIVFGAKPADVDLFHTASTLFLPRCLLPKRSQHRMQIIMQVAALQSFPLIAIQPQAKTALAMVQGKIQSASHQVLGHAKATFFFNEVLTRVIYGLWAFRARTLRQ